MRALVVLLCVSVLCLGSVVVLYVQDRTDYQQGKSFGEAGPYERIVAKALFTSEATTLVELLKPRDPAKGNGTLVAFFAPDPPELPLAEGGYTLLQMPDATNLTAKDVIVFLRYGGPGNLLTDQRRFLKRVLAVVASSNLDETSKYVESIANQDEKGRVLVDGFVFYGPAAKQMPSTLAGAPVVHAMPADLVAKLSTLQHAGPSPVEPSK